MSQIIVPEGLVAQNIANLAAYQPGKPVEELERELGITGAIKLASNENPLGPSPLGIAAAQAALADSNRYADGAGFKLRAALSERLGFPPEEIMLGGGSNELIDLLIRTFCVPGVDEALSHAHAFVMYSVSCQAAGVTYREAPVHADLSCDVDALAAAIGPRTKIVFLPNPNNPTGLYVNRTDFERFVAKVPARVLLIVDEAYYEYAEGIPDYPTDSQAMRTADKPYVISLRTFSKIYGLAGLRAGYGIADRRIVDLLNRVRLPFNVPAPAQAAARAALDDHQHVARSRALNAAGKIQLTDGLRGLGLNVAPSAANFVLVDTGGDGAAFYQSLLKKGVIVRPLRAYGLPRHLRVTIGSESENTRALAAFREVLAR